MIPNQNNYNNCLCEENQIKGFRTLGRDHTSGMFSLGSWKRLRRCFSCSSLKESGSRAWPQLISHPRWPGVFREGESPPSPSFSRGRGEAKKPVDCIRCFIYP